DPFLEDIWNKYKFDDNVNNEDVQRFLPLCNSNVVHSDLTSVIEQIIICTKLLRNLKEAKNRSIPRDEDYIDCYYIYYWLYYKMKVHSISYDIIYNILAKSNNIIRERNNDFLDCSSYMLNDGLREQEESVMLKIFNNNIDVTKKILNEKCASDICSCKRFIKPFLDSYRSMPNNYPKDCKVGGSIDSTCLAVKRFKENYEKYRSEKK
ncbi:hypothetical protein PCYB_007390, partial [Plasmodium cynomolgi strain B]